MANIYTQQWFIGLRRLFLYKNGKCTGLILESGMTNFFLKENKNRTKKGKKKKEKRKKKAKTRKIELKNLWIAKTK